MVLRVGGVPMGAAGYPLPEPKVPRPDFTTRAEVQAGLRADPSDAYKLVAKANDLLLKASPPRRTW